MSKRQGIYLSAMTTKRVNLKSGRKNSRIKTKNARILKHR